MSRGEAGPAVRRDGTARRGTELTVRIVVAVCLGIDALIHLRLAEPMQLAAPGGLGAALLFRAQAALALLAAVAVLTTGRRLAYGLAALAGTSALGPVLLYTYVQVPDPGPIPSMYDPAWYPAKTVSAVAEATALVLALLAVLTLKPTRFGHR